MPAALAAEQWHVLELVGVSRGNKTHYERFTVDGQTHELGIVVVAAPAPDEFPRVAVGVQLDGNARQDPYDVFLNEVSCVIQSQ